MKFPALLTLLLAALLAALPTRHAQAQEVSFEVFYNTLADDGDWYNTPDLGYVWHPAIADGGKWRPYTDGYWAETDDGWTWVSYESFGWATYHYGRWTRLQNVGWAWVPGYQWGPGWVSWRTSDDYVGWAPLPPRPEHAAGATLVDYNDVEAADDGYTAAVDQDYDIGPDNYCFVETRRFGSPVLREVVVPPAQNFVIIERTVNVTNIFYRRGPERTVVYNSGPDFAFISGRVERPIQRLRIERRDDVAYLRDSTRGGGNPTVVRNGVLQVAAPLIARRAVNFEQVKPVRIKQTITETKVVHGWTVAGGDPAQAERLHERIRQQAGAAPRQARADLPPQNVGPAPEVRDRPLSNGTAIAPVEAERAGRRDVPPREKTVRDQPRANGQPAMPGPQDPQAAQDRAARKAERQAREQQTSQQPKEPTQPTPAKGEPARNGREAQRSPEQPQAQPAQQNAPAPRDRDARKAERQQQAQAPQDQPERDARKAERQQPPQPTQAQPERDARRAERQQQAQQTQAPQAQPERDARRAERQQQAQPAQPSQVQPAQPQAEHAAHKAERPQPQDNGNDDKKHNN